MLTDFYFCHIFFKSLLVQMHLHVGKGFESNFGNPSEKAPPCCIVLVSMWISETCLRSLAICCMMFCLVTCLSYAYPPAVKRKG